MYTRTLLVNTNNIFLFIVKTFISALSDSVTICMHLVMFISIEYILTRNGYSSHDNNKLYNYIGKTLF